MSISARFPKWLVERPIAHRGLFENPTLPENSLSAFKAAMNAALPIELDVHLLRDGHPVVFHDHDLKRLTGRSGVIQDLDTEVIRELLLLGTQERVPLFAEALDLVAGAVPLLIEIKSSGPEVGPLEDAVLERLQNYRGDYAIQSFNPLSVDYLRKKAPTICRGQLSDGHGESHPLYYADPDFIAYQVDRLPETLRQESHTQGIALLAWTVRNASQFHRAAALADNIIFEPTPEVTHLLDLRET